MDKKEKILCLIDAQNIYYTPRNIYNAPVDFKKLLDRIKSSTVLDVDTIIYVVADAVINQTSFLEVLQNLGYQVRIKLMRFEKGRSQNTNWDDEIIVEAHELMPDYAGVILISGDHGFIPMLNEWARSGKTTQVLCFERDISVRLVKSSHHINFLGSEILHLPTAV